MFFFFFKQKTAYEMRISDWSSDVCSSDLFCLILALAHIVLGLARAVEHHFREVGEAGNDAAGLFELLEVGDMLFELDPIVARDRPEIGRASCRERVCQYV